MSTRNSGDTLSKWQVFYLFFLFSCFSLPYRPSLLVFELSESATLECHHLAVSPNQIGPTSFNSDPQSRVSTDQAKESGICRALEPWELLTGWSRVLSEINVVRVPLGLRKRGEGLLWLMTCFTGHLPRHERFSRRF
jgi:hypothetical protein